MAMLDPVQLGRLKWRSRRGMLENDLVLTTFFERHQHQLDPPRVAALSVLLDLPDGDLWDLIAGRAQLQPAAPAGVAEVLGLLRACDAAPQAV